MMSHVDNTERSKLYEGGAFHYDAGGWCVSVFVCNQSFLECNLILSQGVTAGPTLGLIPSIHLQRHCQSVCATSQKTKQGKEGEEAGTEVDREGRKEERRDGR